MRLAKSICFLLVTLLPEIAAAQSSEEVREEWVIPYALVGALIGLGLFGICRPNRRSKKVEAAKE